MDKTRKNLQQNQPHIQPMPEGNGWPKPLTDESDQLRFGSKEGKSGSTESRDVSSMSLSNGGHQ